MTLEDQRAEDAERLPYCASPDEIQLEWVIAGWIKILESRNVVLESTSKQDSA